MIKIENGVIVTDFKNPMDILNDIRCAVWSFIKISKEAGAPDQVIEKTLIAMIVEGFKINDKVVLREVKGSDLTDEQKLDNLAKDIIEELNKKIGGEE